MDTQLSSLFVVFKKTGERAQSRADWDRPSGSMEWATHACDSISRLIQRKNGGLLSTDLEQFRRTGAIIDRRSHCI